MSRGRQYIEFEGYFAAGVLGIFKVIRGFAVELKPELLGILRAFGAGIPRTECELCQSSEGEISEGSERIKEMKPKSIVALVTWRRVVSRGVSMEIS